MLNRFSSNTKKLNKVIQKINTNTLADFDLTGSLENIEIPSSTQYEAGVRSNPNPIKFVKTNTLADFDLTGSLENIQIPSSTQYEAGVRSNPNPIKLVNNKQKINQFYTDILQYSGRYVKRGISEIDSVNNKLIIENVKLDYGTEEVSPNNFEIIVGGLNIPGIYEITQVSSSIEITLRQEFIDYQTVTKNDIYVIGKILELQLLTDELQGLQSEDGKIIIL
jgi:hypothetical protein